MLRRRHAAPALLALGTAAAVAVGGPAAAVTSAAVNGKPCPAPQSLVSGTTWAKHRLAPGVTLREGTASDRTVTGAPGAVNMHLLTVSTTRKSVHTGPLYTHLVDRRPLSQLAHGRRTLVAATNTGFFDFYRGAPLGPVFDHGRPLTLGAGGAPVLGFGKDGRLASAHARLVGRIAAGGTHHPLQSVNLLGSKPGLSVYDSRWGFSPVPVPAGRHSVIRVIRHSRVQAGVLRGNQAPSSAGQLVVASTPSTEAWLQRLKSGQRLRIQAHVATTSKRPLVEGYDVGKRLVRSAGGSGKPAAGLGCDERDTQPARTAVGIADGGTKLLILVVADRPGMRYSPGHPVLHGLDHQEMARVMIDLGASQAWEWDGSGSSEMIARMPHTRRLEIRNYCADGAERPMPVGFGIYSSARH